ncbi:kaptin-like, partial [Asbolus verrucosus]
VMITDVDSMMEQLKESHYFNLPSQGNIYTMAFLQVANCPHKILVASLKRDIFCIEYQESQGGLIPTTKEISFTYIPSGAEIIAIDAFNKSQTKNEFVIGIAIIKNSNLLDSLEFYLNIYSEWEENDDFNIDNIAQNCLNVELNFTPYQLTHTDLIIWEDDKIVSREVVFLLSGSDNQIHIYREYADHLYKELENKEYFPEFIKTPSPVVWMDLHFNKDSSEDVLTYGLSNYISLPRHDYTCVLTCCQIADIDFDGDKEILIGNTSEEIMLYKRDPDRGWCLEELKLFASPIISMKYVDVIEDGVKELVVLSMKGVHFLQHDFSFVDKALSDKIVNF